VIKSRRMALAGHVAHMGKRKSAYRILCANQREGEYLEDPDVDGRIIQNGYSRSGMWGHRLDLIGSE
jgi:hypothetical protein